MQDYKTKANHAWNDVLQIICCCVPRLNICKYLSRYPANNYLTIKNQVQE